MTPAGEVAMALALPILILGMLGIGAAYSLIARRIDREQRRLDLLAGVDVEDEDDA